MSDTPDTIWKDDKLRRREEAQLLESFLDSEVKALEAMGREQAFVLALDAQYGEGKTWFLERLRQQLAINHPVAFVDAWVDDANNEPLVSIMAALEDALKPFVQKKSINDHFKALSRAAVPIMGKALVGATGRIVAHLFGPEIGDGVGKAFSEAGRSAQMPAKDDDTAANAAIEEVAKGVNELIDSAGEAMLEQYRARQSSRKAFKVNLEGLAASIDRTGEDRRQSPIFVIVDELDRCRPSYAISLLEEIKHLFDVRGVVFIIALHQKQLEASVKAVYGAEFDAAHYLKRFFSRRYEMRRLSIADLVRDYFEYVPTNVRFSYPETNIVKKEKRDEDIEVVAALLGEWGVTPRDALSVVDGLRLFSQIWPHQNVPIELPLLLKYLLDLSSGDGGGDFVMPEQKHGSVLKFRKLPDRTLRLQDVGKSFGASGLQDIYKYGVSVFLNQAISSNNVIKMPDYIVNKAREEINLRFAGSLPDGSSPKLTWAEYRALVRRVGRLVDIENEDSR
ncbi:P-loop NTPase fold protein [uncultured Sphingomonas sp.]|uniref:KAP family P-loop NTPase fold protein n=1 Tax=uncultured Sphingomonas sp. TaxID=158754 RepID=UPI00258A3200|nr:P-loop NTPase fold protein [uncultured Sphingomonas sp.]